MKITTILTLLLILTVNILASQTCIISRILTNDGWVKRTSEEIKNDNAFIVEKSDESTNIEMTLVKKSNKNGIEKNIRKGKIKLTLKDTTKADSGTKNEYVGLDNGESLTLITYSENKNVMRMVGKKGVLEVICFSKDNNLSQSSEKDICKYHEIPIDNDKMVRTTIEVEGPRGTLKVPALIDTGSSISVIPESIAEGVGYTYKTHGDIHTAAGKRKMKIVTLKKLSFLKFDFPNTNVAIEKNTRSKSEYGFKNGKMYTVNKNSKSDFAIIGMSELTKTNFNYEKGVFKICK